MSLAIESFPTFRKPVTSGGKGNDPLWQIEANKIGGDLEAVQDSPTHVSILPCTLACAKTSRCPLAQALTKCKAERTASRSVVLHPGTSDAATVA